MYSGSRYNNIIYHVHILCWPPEFSGLVFRNWEIENIHLVGQRTSQGTQIDILYCYYFIFIVLYSQATTSLVRRQVSAPVERRWQWQWHVRVLGQGRLEHRRRSCCVHGISAGVGAGADAAATAAVAATVAAIAGPSRRWRRRPLWLRSVVPSTGRAVWLAAASAVSGRWGVPLLTALAPTAPVTTIATAATAAPAAGAAPATTAAVHGWNRLEQPQPIFGVFAVAKRHGCGRSRAFDVVVRLGHAHHGDGIFSALIFRTRNFGLRRCVVSVNRWKYYIRKGNWAVYEEAYHGTMPTRSGNLLLPIRRRSDLVPLWARLYNMQYRSGACR